MGAIIQERDYRPENQAGMLKPIIYCVTSKEMADAVSINKMLAEELIKVRKNRRTMQLERCLSQVISKLPDGAVIKDLDVLFNGKYIYTKKNRYDQRFWRSSKLFGCRNKETGSESWNRLNGKK